MKLHDRLALLNILVMAVTVLMTGIIIGVRCAP